MTRVLVTTAVPDGGLDGLLNPDFEIVRIGEDRPATHDELLAWSGEVDGIVSVLSDRVDRQVLEAGQGRLKVVANIAVGYDNVDLAAAGEFGVAVCHTPGVLDAATADLAVLLILAASRLATTAETALRHGEWCGWSLTGFLGHHLEGRTLGLVGFGRIARAVASRAKALGLHVCHTARRPTSEPGWVEDLDTLLATSDVVSLHVPFNTETYHLIDRRRLEIMRPHAVLVNTARGPIVDEAALAAALHTGSIFAAGLDVYEKEPTVHPDLLTAPRAVLLPHIGSATYETRLKMTRLAVDGLCTVLAGGQPANLVQ